MRLPRFPLHRVLLTVLLSSLFPLSPGIAGEQGAGGDLPATYGDGSRRWTVGDSVALRYLSRPGNGSEADDIVAARSSLPVLWSPDRRHFLALIYQGDLACDCLRYTLSIYDAGQLVQLLTSARPAPDYATPIVRTSFETSLPYTYMSGISAPRWLDNETVLFIGLREGRRQLFQLSVRTRALVQLTRVSASLPTDAEEDRGYGGVARESVGGRALAFTVADRISRAPLSEAYPSVSIADERLTDYHSRGTGFDRLYLSSTSGGEARAVANCLGGIADDFSMSPDGRWLAFGCSRLRAGASDRPFSERDIGEAEPLAFWLTDARLGSMHRIAAAARGPRRIIWRSDGKRVALIGVLVSDAGCGSTPSTPQVAVFDLDAQRLSCVTSMPAGIGSPSLRVSGIRWEGAGDLVVAYATQQRRLERTFSQRRGQWRGGPETDMPPTAAQAPSRAAGLDVQVREDLNRPWSLVARFRDREIALTQPDPALERLGWAPVREVSWEEGGHTVRGGLILPRDHQPGTRLPLVIQIGDYHPGMFLADGSASTIFAAQALAAQGMAVLNADIDPEPGQPYTTRPDAARPDLPRMEDLFRARIDAVIHVLDARGLIDPARVGLVGFSYTGYQTHYLATHPGRSRLAAAIAADSWTGSYGLYNYYAGAVNSTALAARMDEYWGASIWENREAWLRNAPIFNVQNITAPILFEQHRGIGAAIPAMETLAAYRMLNKPFEYFLFPRGEHQLRLPRERAASMGNNVSWMAFWLQGREIPGLQTEETYARWRRMRELRDRNAQTPVTPAPLAQPAVSRD